jgi:P pilus assembly chaperone PapD
MVKNMFTSRSLTQLLLLVGSLVFSSFAIAETKLGVSPIQIDLSPNVKTGVITLVNKDKKPVNLQLDAKSWDMDDNGKFIEVDTGDFIFYPKTLTIAPQQSAIIRAGYMGEFPNVERPFRIIIEEIPEIIQAKRESNKVKAGLVSALRLSIPLYVVSDNNIPPPQLELGGLKTEQNTLRVGVKNLTAYHVDLKRVSVKLLKQDKVLAEKAVDLQLQRVLGNRLVFINVPMGVKNLCNQADGLALQIDTNNLTAAYQKKLALKPGCQL